MRKISFLKSSLLVFCIGLSCGLAQAQTTEFTYQGKLNDTGTPSATYDFTFRLCNSPAADCSTPLATQTITGVPVSNGIFAVKLNFGAGVFDGSARWLEIAVKRPADGTYQTLSPRQSLTSEPYSITANNALQLGGIQANQYLTTTGANTNYIQNTTSQQTSSNFNISGTGAANIFDVVTQFNIGGNRILSNSGSENLFAGVGAGISNSTGIENAFFGRFAGNSNNTGSGNSFFGFVAGRFTLGGNNNSFFGNRVGIMNSSGNFNSFFGHRAGESSNGSANSFFGTGAGLINNSGNSNSFFGHDAGNFNSSGSFNVVVGDNADVGLQNLTNAIAIGANSLVSQSNSLILGSINGINNATADTFVGIGTNTPTSKFHLSGNGIIRARINSDSNAGIGLALNEQSLWSVATVSPGHFQIFNDRLGQNALFISTFDNSLNTGTLNVSGIISVTSLGNAGSTALCRNSSNQISICSSSLRYKSNINDFYSGLDLIKQLRPVSFNWRGSNQFDFGLVAEEVAKVEPLLATYNEKGETEGVKYDRVGVVLVNAVKEQQAQIEQQQKIINQQIETIKNQQVQLDALKALVCSQNATASFCQPKN